MDTFVIKHLFESKSLKELLINAPKNEGEISIFKQNLEELTKKKENEIKQKNKFYSLLSNPDLEDDEQVIKDYTVCKNKLNKLTNDINELTLKIAEVSNENRNQVTKTLIESYTKNVDFEILKKLVNSLVDRIDVLYDRKPTSHGGVFTFVISYRNFEEKSTFISKSSLFDFSWINYYRNISISEFDLNEDRQTQIDLLAYNGINSEENYLKELAANNLPLNNYANQWSNEFKGSECLISKNEKISFCKEELINTN